MSLGQGAKRRLLDVLEAREARDPTRPAIFQTVSRNCFAIVPEVAFLSRLGAFSRHFFQRVAPVNLRSMMRLITQWIIATPVSGNRS